MKFIMLRYFGVFLSTIRGLVVAKFLGPEFFGVYAFILVMQQQLSVLAFGMRESITISLSDSSISSKDFSSFFSNALVFTVFSSLLMILLSIYEYNFAYIGLLTGWNSNSISIALLVASSMVLSEIFYNVLRVEGKFLTIGLMEVIFSIVCLLVVINEIYAYETSIFRVFIYFFLFNTMLVLYQFKILSRFYIFQNLSLKYLKKLLNTGIRMQVINFSIVILLTLAHYSLASVLSPDAYGVFAFGASVSIFALIGGQSYIWMNYSKALNLWSLFTNDQSIGNIIEKTIQKFQVLFYAYTLIIFFLIYYLADFFINIFFIEYINSKEVIGIMFAAGSCHLIIFYELSFLIQNKKYKLILCSSFTSFLSFILLLSLEQQILSTLSINSMKSLIFHPICLFISNIIFVISINIFYSISMNGMVSAVNYINKAMSLIMITMIALFFVINVSLQKYLFTILIFLVIAIVVLNIKVIGRFISLPK